MNSFEKGALAVGNLLPALPPPTLLPSGTLPVTCLPAVLAGRAQRHVVLTRAQQDGAGPSTPPPAEDEESRLEAFEAAVRAKKGVKAVQAGTAPRRPQAASDEVEWKEGSLFPEKWDEMDPLEKATQIYMGKYGALYWANKAAWFSIIGVGGLWVVLRIVLPALGLYRTADDLGTPNL